MFTAYFDESGKDKDTHALTVAGGVSSVQKWLRLEKRWQAVLASRGVAIFHMSECAHGLGEFKGWNGEKRKSFIAELGECMSKNIKQGIAVTVMLEDWRRVDQDFELSERLISPYVYASQQCIAAVQRWMKRTKADVPVEYVFEDGDDDRGKLLDFINRLYSISPISSKPPKETASANCNPQT